mmetsp:Transcript_28440/g.86976  ORF Transcript_28440/g.86976 Transcript_28440/m.86976 type:complete len:204 (+) Transcript_28440:1648-2259(+)
MASISSRTCCCTDVMAVCDACSESSQRCTIAAQKRRFRASSSPMRVQSARSSRSSRSPASSSTTRGSSTSQPMARSSSCGSLCRIAASAASRMSTGVARPSSTLFNARDSSWLSWNSSSLLSFSTYPICSLCLSSSLLSFSICSLSRSRCSRACFTLSSSSASSLRLLLPPSPSPPPPPPLSTSPSPSLPLSASPSLSLFFFH